MENSMKKNAIVFLEPINHVYKVMLAAVDMGFEVIVMHELKLHAPSPYENAINAISKDIQISDWSDKASLLDLLLEQSGEYEICGSYTGAEIALAFESHLRKHLQLPGHSPAAVDELLNKRVVRRKLFEAGLTRLASYSVEEIAEMEQWPFADRPGIFKPCNGGASALVYKCHSLEDVRRCAESWSDKSQVTNPLLLKYIEQKNEYFLEGYAEGELMSVESLLFEGEVIHLGILSRTVLERDPTIEMGACFPRNHPFKDAIIKKVAAIHKVLNITHGATHIELMVTADGEIEMVELNLRFAGADSLEIISMAYDRNIGKELVRLSCGLRPELDDVQPNRFASMQYLLAPNSLRQLSSLEFPVNADFVRTFVAPDAVLGENRNQVDWVGCFIVANDKYEDLIDQVNRIRTNLQMNGANIGDDVNNRVLVS